MIDIPGRPPPRINLTRSFRCDPATKIARGVSSGELHTTVRSDQPSWSRAWANARSLTCTMVAMQPGMAFARHKIACSLDLPTTDAASDHQPRRLPGSNRSSCPRGGARARAARGTCWLRGFAERSIVRPWTVMPSPPVMPRRDSVSSRNSRPGHASESGDFTAGGVRPHLHRCADPSRRDAGHYAREDVVDRDGEWMIPGDGATRRPWIRWARRRCAARGDLLLAGRHTGSTPEKYRC